MKKLILIFFFFSFAQIYAQAIDNYIELLKSDVKTEKVEIITEVMEFTDQEAELFWPIYRDFVFQLDKLADKRVANIKDFAANFDSLTDAKADELIERSFDFQEERLNINRKFYEKLALAITPTVAAKYMQLEHEIQLILDLGISSSLPLAKKPGS